MPNISPILNSTQIALERAAADKFGAVVDEFTRGALGVGLRTPVASNAQPTDRGDGSWYATSYASALAGGTNYRPKLKFLFKVQFIFKPDIISRYPSLANNEFTFMIRSVDRPKIDFEYEEEVNLYNFRTMVLKKIRHRALTMTFYDDTGNRVFDFFRTLMMVHSPITRRQLSRDGTNEAPVSTSVNRGNGMLFTDANNPNGNSLSDNARRGAVTSDTGNAIEAIRVKQIFVDPTEQLNNAVKEVIFDFVNAHLISFDLDELTHDSSDPNTLTMQFDYDWMEMVKVGSLEVMDGPELDIVVPGVSGAPSDMTTPGGVTSPAGGLGNDVARILARQAGRAGQQITSTLVNRAVRSTAGGGRFASLLGSTASTALGGLVQGAFTDRLGGLFSTVTQSTARPAARAVVDNVTAGADRASYTTSIPEQSLDITQFYPSEEGE